MSIIVFQNWDVGGPGRLGSTLRDHGHKLEIIRTDRGENAPSDLDGVRGVVCLGGPQSVTEPEGWMSGVKDFMRRAHEAELPVIGVCLGAQMLAEALGGETSRAPSPEYGFCPVQVEIPGQTAVMTAGVPWTHLQFQSHSDQVSKAPPGATTLMGGVGDGCTKVQMFSAGLRSYGFQFHFEAGRQGIEAYGEAEPDMLEKCGLTMDTLRAQLDEHYDRFAVISDRLCINLCAHAFPFSSLTAV